MAVLVALLVLMVIVATLAEEVNVNCSSDSVIVTWKLNQSLASEPLQVALGNCEPSSYSPVSDGAVVIFYAFFRDCNFQKIVTDENVFYMSTLSFKRSVKSENPGVFYEVVCALDRGSNAIPPVYVSPHSHVVGYGGLNFYMELMNGDFSGPACSLSFPLGSRIPIWVAVDEQAHMPLILFLEECVASSTPELGTSSQIYPLIANGGCLVDAKTSTSMFLPRVKTSELRLFLEAFSFAIGEDVYIHCKMVAWDPEMLTKRMKACNYNKELGGWELLDDPSRSSLCSCCDSHCTDRKRRHAGLDPQGLVQQAVLGPITIQGVEPK